MRRIKELQPEASNRAIAQAIGIGETTVRRDIADAPHGAAEPKQASVSVAMDDADAPHGAPPAQPAEAEDEDLPAFLIGEDWSLRERAHAFALYLGLPDEVQPTVAALLEQPGICVPDVVTMLDHIATMDAA